MRKANVAAVVPGKYGIRALMRRQGSLVVSDDLLPCPYIAGQVARMPLEWFGNFLSGDDLDQLLARGYRRSGPYFYRPQCPSCTACEPIRVPVATFRPTATQRRVWRHGQIRFRVEMTQVTVDEERLGLFNRHRLARRLDDEPASLLEYETFLGETACHTVEIDYRVGEQLVAVAITDIGSKSWSAVYCYFDPQVARWSPGVFSILTQLRLAGQHGAEYLYLGLYAAEAAHLKYKVQYRPHQRLIGGQWVTFSTYNSGRSNADLITG